MAPACSRTSLCAPFTSVPDSSDSQESLTDEPPRAQELGTGRRDSSMREKLPLKLSAEGSNTSTLQDGQISQPGTSFSHSDSSARLAELCDSTCVSEIPGQYIVKNCSIFTIPSLPYPDSSSSLHRLTNNPIRSRPMSSSEETGDTPPAGPEIPTHWSTHGPVGSMRVLLYRACASPPSVRPTSGTLLTLTYKVPVTVTYPTRIVLPPLPPSNPRAPSISSS